MGPKASKIFSGSWGPKNNEEWNVVMIGLDGAGKTSLTLLLKSGFNLASAAYTAPTIGFNVEIVKPIKGLKFTMWDIGGQAKLRRLWSNYYTACRAVIFMVDSTDAIRFPEARTALHQAMMDPAMPEHAPVIVLANKQDEVGKAYTPEQLAPHLDVHQLGNHEARVLGTSVINNIGVLEAMQELKLLLKQTSKLRHWS